MAEALKCPSCAAPLELPPGGGNSMRCPYCNTVVLLSGRGEVVSGGFGTGNSGPGQNTAVMGQIAELLRGGKKIEAIRIYRQTFGTGLAGAKAVIDRMDSGGSRPGSAATVIKGTGMGLGVRLALAGILIGVAMIVAKVIIHAQARSDADQAQLTPLPSGTPTTDADMPAIPAVPAPPPEWAQKVMEFGAEGIGAGQFKDSRSVAVDGAGKIYVGEYSDGRIQEFDAKGNFISEFSIGHDKALLNLTADHQGNLYVVLPGDIIKYDGSTHMPMGELENMFNGSPLDYFDAYAALDGDVYAVAGSDIVDIGPDGKIKTVVDESDKVGESVDFNRIAVSGALDIYALDEQKGIFRFASDGRYINRWGAQDDSDPAQINHFNNLAIDGNGNVYASGDGPAVSVFDSTGRALGSFGGGEVVFGLAVDDKNEVFGCFRNLNLVREYAGGKR